MSAYACCRCGGPNIQPVEDPSDHHHEEDAPDDREKGWCDDCGDISFIDE